MPQIKEISKKIKQVKNSQVSDIIQILNDSLYKKQLKMKKKLVVYTALFGNYDDLIDPKVGLVPYWTKKQTIVHRPTSWKKT